MKLPLRSRIVCVAGMLCLAACGSRSSCAQPVHVGWFADLHGASPHGRARPHSSETVVIPGPLRSFLRMAGISQQVANEDVAATLARNVSLYGFQTGKETEFLLLLNRYVRLARELQRFTDAHGMITVRNCSEAAPLIHVLGYKFEVPCGQRNTSLMTENPERAFLTIDSGFPITTLEQALERHEPFSYAFPSTRVPILFTDKTWTSLSTWKRVSGPNVLDVLLNDQTVDRLYWAMSRCDEETRTALSQSPGLRKLSSLAPVFDLYGSMIRIHDGAVAVPAAASRDWQSLADASPNSPGEFVNHLLTRDHGWLAAYFDALAHLSDAEQAHIAEQSRISELYHAYRSTVPRVNAAEGIFPRNAYLLILLTSMKWNAAGEPEIPGEGALWQESVSRNKTEMRLLGVSNCCDTPERRLQFLVAASNFDSATGPLQLYLLLNAINAGRPEPQRISPATDRLIAGKLGQFDRWFSIFAEFTALDDNSIAKFVAAAERVQAIKTPALRANALGAFQANIGLWQIFARQSQIPFDKQNAAWQGVVQPFMQVSSSVQLFEAARHSLEALLTVVANRPNLSQDELVELLAGPAQDSQDGQRVHREIAERLRTVLDDQRLVSLDTLFELYDGLGEITRRGSDKSRLLPLAEQLHDFEMPRPIFTGNERTTWSPVVYSSRHAELQIRTDLARVIQGSPSAAQIEAARGQLAPFLRDTLVGLNYAYYEPPGAEVLHHNPLFVRSHDFSSISILGEQETWADPVLIGVGATAGGGAYLMGSLEDLPYALATTESEFIAPKNTQALIWQEAVPELLVDAMLPRWWAVSKDELHAAALYQRAGDELLDASSRDRDLREKVLSILADRMSPARLEQIELALDSQQGSDGPSSSLLPAESFFLATEFRRRYAGSAALPGSSGKDLDELGRRNPAAVRPERISEDFGVPHPTLMLSGTCSLFNMKPPPLYGGHASRLLGESWESNNLYWARLADESGYSPVMLNLLVPALTRRMVTNIFASNIDDWNALFRAMQETGAEFRSGKINVIGVTTVARQ